MAWTSPRTWVAGETVTAALMNTHVRDNLLETTPAKVTTQGDIVYATGANAIARLAKGTKYQGLRMNSGATAPEWANAPITIPKTADETISTTTTLQDDDELSFAVGANEVWLFEIVLFGHGNTSSDIKIAFSIPSGASGRWGGVGFNTSEVLDAQSEASLTNPHQLGVVNSSNDVFIASLFGTLITAGSSGTFKLQWAQYVSGGSTTVAKGSFLRMTQVS